jgi:hypothetical protein
MSLVNQHVQLQNLAPLLIFASIEGFKRGTTFILMAMEVHNAPRHDMDRFIKECVHLFHNSQSEGHLFLSFCIQFFK